MTATLERPNPQPQPDGPRKVSAIGPSAFDVTGLRTMGDMRHNLRFRSDFLTPSAVEALSWRICAELARRHPGRLRVLELHPCTGQYDCLSLMDLDDDTGRVQANRVGSIHAFSSTFDDTIWTWEDYMRADPREFLLEVERAADLVPPRSVPASTPTTLAYRAIAAVLTADVAGVQELEALNGVADSDLDVDVRESLFDVFPDALGPHRDRGRRRPDERAEYRFWFLCRDGEPVAAIDDGYGVAFWPDGTEWHLMDVYRAVGRHLATTVACTLRPAMR